MDVSEIEESLFAAGDAKLHGEMCQKLSAIVRKVLDIFPVLEDSRPRSKSGIQALCSLHVALDRAKTILQHCSNCSKLYLAITGDSVLAKFEKARCSLQESLRRVKGIVPQAIGGQIIDIVGELEETTFMLDQTQKQAGDEVIQLLQREKNLNGNSIVNEELEIFHQAATQLGITSSRAALTERRALKKLVERAQVEEDKRKESIVAYLLHLMRKYSKLFRSEITDDSDYQGSAPCSPTVMGCLEESYGSGASSYVFEKQLSRICTFNFKTNGPGSGSMPIPPEEFRCPISLQLMYDPVIISSGQTYERVCIEKWFNDGHHTCPKTQQQLSHLCLTPNYCVKGLITSWCEQNGVPLLKGPPDSLDLNYWRLALSDSEATDSRSTGSVNSYKPKGIKVVPFEDSCVKETVERHDVGHSGSFSEVFEVDEFEKYVKLLSVLREGKNIRKQQKVVEQIRIILKDDEEARTYMGANGFTEALVQFLRLAVEKGDLTAQEIGAMALFNLAVNNNRNKGMLLSAGIIPLLEEMTTSSAYEAATALYLNLSCFDDAKATIGASNAVPFLVQLLRTSSCDPQCQADALHALYNLSTHPSNVPMLLSAGTIDGLHALINGPSGPAEGTWAEKSIAVFINLASSMSGKREIISTPGLVGAIAAVLENSEPSTQEQAVSCLLLLCNGDQMCSEMVLQEGVIPSLVSVSINGTARGREKAQKLLMLFREQRQRQSDPSAVKTTQEPPRRDYGDSSDSTPERKTPSKSTSKRRVGRALTAMWKSKSFSMYQC